MSIIEKALDKNRARQPVPEETAEQAAAPEAAAREPERWREPVSQEVSIDFAWLRKQGLIVPGDQRSSVAEEFRMMKRPLLNNAFGRHAAMRVPKGRLIMITSSLPGEGKTFTSVNLALSMAMELERTVLLVDADVSRPAIPRTLGFHADLGLMDVLSEPDIQIPDVLLRTNVENLTVLPAGRPHGRSTEILASDVMRDLVDDLHDRYEDRIILFDSPPLLATSEPGVLATHMGQVVMVVEADRTPASTVERAMHQLDSCGVVLTSLNRATPGIGIGGQYYGGSYYGIERDHVADTSAR
ncbi:XrtA-associated tyrosine autokinase [Thioalkalivibrio versutus]|uniref:XrtA-associated tyrosine autokinase n=1 Tax=Thioalkalivibrio versutus TaxID=106634 RepID=UPI0003826097|nr:XrtA-associated tyrosine autokinase [Thioalkalivibrio versutus]OOC51315.1 protein tyrosine kinase [Thioalkalivibrio versutus]